MASPKQIEANQINSQHSTGPVTPEGKANTAKNAIAHSLAMPNPDTSSEEFQAKLESWRTVYHANGLVGERLLEQLVWAMMQIDNCDLALRNLTARKRNEAESAWSPARRAEVAKLAEKLHERPEVIFTELQKSRYGCDYLLQYWDRLGQALDSESDWNESERATVLDLLGIPPRLRNEKVIFSPDEGVDLVDHLHGIRDEAVAELLMLRDEMHESGDNLARQQAYIGSMTVLSAEGRLLMRYRRDAERRFEKAHEQLLASCPQPAFVPAPVVRPFGQPAVAAIPPTAAPEPLSTPKSRPKNYPDPFDHLLEPTNNNAPRNSSFVDFCVGVRSDGS